WVRPVRLHGANGHVGSIELEYTKLGDDGRLAGTGDTTTLPADSVFTAIGQILIADPVADGAGEPLDIQGGRIVVNEELQTSLPGVFAGGDCIAGLDLTVQAVEDGKVAARSIHRYLT
ncbi:MAG: FAD-dependent oxidoreductase, partial [Rhodospirillaceae bacterium]|nr:FAD-dependent oxidoreductase [Rhodospirillaceae bacterium]